MNTLAMAGISTNGRITRGTLTHTHAHITHVKKYCKIATDAQIHKTDAHKDTDFFFFKSNGITT